MRTLIGLAVAAMLALAGCGQSDEDRVSSSLEDFYAALGARDGEKACGYLSPAARGDLLAPLLLSGARESVDPQALEGEGVCVSVVGSLDVRAVAVVGDIAEADVEDVDLEVNGASVTTSSGTYAFGERDGEIKLLGLGPLVEALEAEEALQPGRQERFGGTRQGPTPPGGEVR